MQIHLFTSHSFLLSLIWGDFFVLILTVCRKRASIFLLLGPSIYSALYCLSLIRLLLPIAFSLNVRRLFSESLLLAEIRRAFIKLWALFALLFLIICFSKNIGIYRNIKKSSISLGEYYHRILSKAVYGFRHSLNIRILLCPLISIPFCLGIRHWCILLPTLHYSDRELCLILRHEYIHLIKRDLLWLWFLNSAKTLFFWNPAMKKLRSEFQIMMEMRCDSFVIKGMDRDGKMEYLKMLLKIFNESKISADGPLSKTSYVRNFGLSSLSDRFTVIYHNSAGSKQDKTFFLVRLIFISTGLLLFGVSFILP